MSDRPPVLEYEVRKPRRMMRRVVLPLTAGALLVAAGGNLRASRKTPVRGAARHNALPDYGLDTGDEPQHQPRHRARYLSRPGRSGDE